MLIELPQPKNGVTRPKTVQAVAYVNAYMVKREARGGPFMQNGVSVVYMIGGCSRLRTHS